MALVALACGSALAKDDDRNGDQDRNVVFVDCSQVQQVFVTQGQYSDANAVAVGDGEAVAAVAQDLDISQAQVNACLGNLGGGEETTTGDTTTGDTTTGDTTTGDTTTGDTTRDTTTGDTTAETADTAGVIASTVPEADELPDTGGAGGIALAAGCALLGVGLIVNRVFR
jgi:hypothetical protein